MLTLLGTELIAEERERQINEKDYTAEFDKQHTQGELAAAAMSYIGQALGLVHHGSGIPPLWPWAPSMWKPEDSQLENLIKAGAFIAAEIDRVLAAAITNRPGTTE